MIPSPVGVHCGRVLLVLAVVFAAEVAVSARSVRSVGARGAAVTTQDHDDALSARARGEIQSLEEILQLLKPKPTDRLVDVVLDRRDGRWIYEVTWLTKLGRYHITTVNAKDGVILKDETK
jgi:uncharacterized membrane protein YkoI